MRALLLSRSLPTALATRAVGLWALLRLLLAAVFLLIPTEVTPGHAAEAPSPNPAMVIALCALIGLVDVRRRRETMLWQNLGVSVTQLMLWFAGTALLGELLVASVIR